MSQESHAASAVTTTSAGGPPKSADEIVALCRSLAEGFKKRSPIYDREGSFPVENFADLKDAGLLGIMVPREHGGMGANFLTYTRAIEQLAIGDAPTALTFNMHNIAVGSLAEVSLEGLGENKLVTAMREFQHWVFDEAVRGKKLFASASSEPGTGAHFSKFKTSYKRAEGGFVIDGEKSFVSMAGYADYYVVAARSAHAVPGAPAISFLVVDKDNPGVEFKKTWDTLGMRATSTNPMIMRDCYVPRNRLFMASEDMALHKIAREPHWLVGGYNGVYLGIATAAFEFLISFLRNKKQPGTETPVADNPLVQHRVGELSASLRSARLATHHAAHLIDERRGTAEANEAIHHAKYLVSEIGPWLTSAAIRLCGATALAKALPLERYYRDARCGGLMPATSDECLQYLGKAAFGADLRKPQETYW
jgi:alkylation response protein AidB-like acyl-CoA dehydrogenase